MLPAGGTKCRICWARLAPAVFSHGRVRSAAPSGSGLRGSRRRDPRAPWPPVLSRAHMYIHPHTRSYHRSKVGSGQMTRLQGLACRREGKLCPRPVCFLRSAQDHGVWGWVGGAAEHGRLHGAGGRAHGRKRTHGLTATMASTFWLNADVGCCCLVFFRKLFHGTCFVASHWI